VPTPIIDPALQNDATRNNFTDRVHGDGLVAGAALIGGEAVARGAAALVERSFRY
jgi:hypothetical protein